MKIFSLTTKCRVYPYFASFLMNDLSCLLAYIDFKLTYNCTKVTNSMLPGKKNLRKLLAINKANIYATDGLEFNLESLLSFWMLAKGRK